MNTSCTCTHIRLLHSDGSCRACKCPDFTQGDPMTTNPETLRRRVTALAITLISECERINKEVRAINSELDRLESQMEDKS